MPDELQSDIQATAEDIAADSEVLHDDRDREGEPRRDRPAHARARQARRAAGPRHRGQDGGRDGAGGRGERRGGLNPRTRRPFASVTWRSNGKRPGAAASIAATMADRPYDYVIVGGGSAGSVAREPALGRPVDARPRARGRPVRLADRPVHPHAGGAHLSDRQPVLRLEVRVRARAVHARPEDLPRPGQGPRREQQHQRADLPARQPARLRALGGRPGHGDLGLRPLPAVLQADGDGARGRRRRSVARARWPARPGAWAGHEPVVHGVLRERPGGRLPADRGRQRLSTGGLRGVRSEHPSRPPPVRGAGVPASGHGQAQEPRGADPDLRDPGASSRGAGRSGSRSRRAAARSGSWPAK